MWINNYDDPPDMDFDTAIRLLRHNGYRDATVAANKRMNTRLFRVYRHPQGKDRGEYYCRDEDEVIDLAIGEGLSFEDDPRQAEDDARVIEAIQHLHWRDQ